jgi:hypothetical protein
MTTTTIDYNLDDKNGVGGICKMNKNFLICYFPLLLTNTSITKPIPCLTKLCSFEYNICRIIVDFYIQTTLTSFCFFNKLTSCKRKLNYIAPYTAIIFLIIMKMNVVLIVYNTNSQSAETREEALLAAEK